MWAIVKKDPILTDFLRVLLINHSSLELPTTTTTGVLLLRAQGRRVDCESGRRRRRRHQHGIVEVHEYSAMIMWGCGGATVLEVVVSVCMMFRFFFSIGAWALSFPVRSSVFFSGPKPVFQFRAAAPVVPSSQDPYLFPRLPLFFSFPHLRWGNATRPSTPCPSTRKPAR